MSRLEKLFSAAAEAKKNAYAPYSEFAVGCAVLADNGKIYTGCNVENISYPCGTCAEAGAIAAMNLDGSRKIKEILITADGQDLIAPCGACLQRIAEFADSATLVHLADTQAVRKSIKLSELLPFAFKERSLQS